MEHQYPAPISGDESMLAELMLPDQTHVRSQDWTIFFLHKDTSAEDEEESAQEKKKKRKNRGDRSPGTSEGDDGLDDDPDASAGEDSSDEEEGGEGPPLMYVLNLVNTKQDNTVKRYIYPLYDLLACNETDKLQRCSRKGYGDLYATLVSSYIQSKPAML